MQSPFFKLMFVLSLFCSNLTSAQFGKKYFDSTEVHFVNPYLSASFGAAGNALNSLGIERLRTRNPIGINKILALSIDDVNAFDRFALKQDVTERARFSKNSDRWRDLGLIFPAFLFIDKKARNQWLEILLMYTEAHAFNGMAYAYSPLGPTFIERLRPVTYYDEISISARTGARNKNSFFSGHTSTTATGSFFAAKVLSDFHPEWGAKRILLYTAAAIPPALVGYYRIKSLNHFLSDTIVGFAVGALSGILVPHIHKIRQRKLRESLKLY